jgi:F-type H+-transporting ATPase subunit b
MSSLGTAEFWVLGAFVLFIALTWKMISRQVGGALDARAEKIRGEIEQAQRLREDAEKILGEITRKQRDALKEAEGMLAQAKAEAERMRTDSAAHLDAMLKRREALSVEKIRQAEAQALAEVRQLAAQYAVSATAELLRSQLDAKRGGALIDKAIAELPQRLH